MLAAVLNTDVLWRNALIAIPLALLVGVLCRVMPLRASTRHLLWMVVLGVLFLPPGVGRLAWLGTAATSDETASVPEESHRPRGAEAGGAVSAHAAVQDESHRPRRAVTGGTVSDRVDADRPARAAAAGGAGVERLRSDRGVSAGATRLDTRDAAGAPAGLWRGGTPASIRSALAGPERETAHPALRIDHVVPATVGHVEVPPRPLAELFPPVTGLEDHRAGESMRGFAPPPVTIAPVSPLARPSAREQVVSSVIAPALSKARQWGGAAQSALAAVASLPALPSGLWLAGSVGLAVIAAWRALRHGRMLRRAMAAPPEVLAMVGEAAAALGLRRIPETLMVRERLSPMIWCGRRARLVLPVELWEELDEAGRRAVMHHELAHLKRLDHWVCWAELIASAVYWWHPLVWIVRRRLREEADLCCDAWVTMTMPRSRRAYAEALLETRRFISESRGAPPAVGLGAISGRARHFARRLTMVMTQRMTPRRSVSGMILAVAVGAAGVFSAPLLACPPEEGKDGKEKSKHTTVAEGLTVLRAPQAARAPQAPRAPEAPRAPRAPRAAVAPATPAPPAPPAQPFAGGYGGPSVPGAAPRARVGGMGGMAPGQPGMPGRPGVQGRPGGVGGASPSTPAPARKSGDLDQRLRRLEQRLDQLNRRMDQMMERLNRRSDAGDTLPALLGTTQLDLAPLTAVTVGTLEDGEKMVVVLVGPGDRVQAFHVDEGQVAGLRAMLSANGEAVGVERRTLEEHARAMVERAQGNTMRGDQDGARAEAERFQAMAERAGALAAQQDAFAALHDRLAREQHEALGAGQVARAQELAARAMNSAAVRDAMTKAARERARAQANKARDYEHLADRLRERAETVTERAETLAERLAEVQESAESMTGRAREERLKAAEQLRREIEALKEAVERIREQADELSGQADEFSSQSDDEADEAEEAAEVEEIEADEPAEADPEPSIAITAPITVIGGAPVTAGSCCQSAAKAGECSVAAPITTTAPSAVVALPPSAPVGAAPAAGPR